MARALAPLLIILTIPCLGGAGNWPAPCPDRSRVELEPPALMTTCPAGDGPAFEHIDVFALTPDGEPIEGLPASQFFFTVDGEVTVAPVEEATDENGRIRFTITGDGSFVRLGRDWLRVECRIATVPLRDADSLHVNSFDLDADGCVDSKDVSVFQSLYLSESLRADYFRDGKVDMRDLSVLVDHDGHCAPEGADADSTGLPTPGERVETEQAPTGAHGD